MLQGVPHLIVASAEAADDRQVPNWDQDRKYKGSSASRSESSGC